MRYWYSLAVLQGMAILYGGYGHPQRLSDTFALRFGLFLFHIQSVVACTVVLIIHFDLTDTKIPTWVGLRPRGDIPGPSSTHSVCVIKDRMYIFGGYDGKYRRGQLFAFEIGAFRTSCRMIRMQSKHSRDTYCLHRGRVKRAY